MSRLQTALSLRLCVGRSRQCVTSRLRKNALASKHFYLWYNNLTALAKLKISTPERTLNGQKTKFRRNFAWQSHYQSLVALLLWYNTHLGPFVNGSKPAACVGRSRRCVPSRLSKIRQVIVEPITVLLAAFYYLACVHFCKVPALL